MRTKQEYLIRYKDGNLYCELADIWIDTSKPVKKSLITNAHFDKFTFGCEEYIYTNENHQILNHKNIVPSNRFSFNKISSFMINWSNKFVVIALLTISAIALSKQAWA